MSEVNKENSDETKNLENPIKFDEASEEIKIKNSEPKKIEEEEINEGNSGPPFSAIVFGSSGACGRYVVSNLINVKWCKKILLINRRKGKYEHEKIEELIWDDFGKHLSFNENPADETIGVFKGYDCVFSCLGVPKGKAKSKKQYKDVNMFFGINIGIISKKAGIEKFYFISSAGANHSSSNLYLQMKGTVDKKLIEMEFQVCGIFRPSLLIAEREEKKPFEDVMKFFLPIVNIFNQHASIKVEDVGKGMVNYHLVQMKIDRKKGGFLREIVTTEHIKEFAKKENI